MPKDNCCSRGLPGFSGPAGPPGASTTLLTQTIIATGNNSIIPTTPTTSSQFAEASLTYTFIPNQSTALISQIDIVWTLPTSQTNPVIILATAIPTGKIIGGAIPVTSYPGLNGTIITSFATLIGTFDNVNFPQTWIFTIQYTYG